MQCIKRCENGGATIARKLRKKMKDPEPTPENPIPEEPTPKEPTPEEDKEKNKEKVDRMKREMFPHGSRNRPLKINLG